MLYLIQKAKIKINFKLLLKTILLKLKKVFGIVIKHNIEIYLHTNRHILEMKEYCPDLYITDVFTKCYVMNDKNNFYSCSNNLAEIYINLENIKLQFKNKIIKINHFFTIQKSNFLSYLLSYVIHGFLHSLKFDHNTIDREKEMLSIEKVVQKEVLSFIIKEGWI